MRHSAVRDPEEEEEDQSSKPNPSLDPVSPTTSSRASPSGVHCSRSSCSPLSGDTVLCNPTQSTCKELFSQWKLNQNIQLTGSTDFPLSHIPSVGPLKEVASHVHTGQPPGVSLQLPQPYSAQGPSGAARAHYLPMSTGLKLEIPSQRHDEYAGVRLSPSHIQHSLPSITSSPELVRPPTSPAVAVRLQTDTLTPACAIYTTLSQTTPPSPQEPIDAGSHNTSVLTSEYISHSDINPDIHQWSVDGLRSSSSGGNKRMLSPSNSIELNPESQQQQKRVKEEEEREERCVDKSLVDTSNKVDKRENQSCLSSVSSPIRHIRPSFPSLLSSTCNSWCYLNYIKPNPSTLDEQKPSVYSSWSISGYDPNPPGLSSKTALSLLHCKQRLSPSIYTMSPMSVSTPESMEPDDSKRPCSTEVLICQSYRKDHEETREGHRSAKDNRSNKGEEEEEEKQQEEVQSSCRYKQPPQVWILEGGSNVKYGFAQRGGGGKYECEDCGFHCKNPSATQKHTHLHTESTPPVCRQCNFASKAKDNFNKNRRSKAHKAHGEESCYSPDDIDEGACEDSSAHPDEQKARKHSDLGGSGHADDSNDKNKKHDGGQKSKSSHSPGTASSHHEKPADPGGQIREPEPSQSLTLTPKDPTQKCVAGSASARRALFARRHLQPSTSAPSRGPSSPSSQSPRRESSPPRSPSPRPHQPPPSSLSPSGCHVSLSPLRPISPVRGLSPVTLQSHGSGSLGPSSSYTATSAQNQICLLPRGRAATARLSVDDTGPTHFTLHPGQPRGALKVLSHLPLHSQQPTRAPSLMIPIGGIHMIQPRSALPLYSLVSSPTPTQANPSPAGTEQSQRPADIPAGRLLLLQRQDTLKETGPCSQASPPGHKAPGETSGSGRLTGLPGRNGSRRECFGPQEPLGPGKETKPLPSDAKASTLHQEAADAHATQRCVYPQTAQGQKAPSSQTQL